MSFDQRPSNLCCVAGRPMRTRAHPSRSSACFVTCGVRSTHRSRVASLRNKILPDAINRSLALTVATFQTNNSTSCRASLYIALSDLQVCSLVNKKRWLALYAWRISVYLCRRASLRDVLSLFFLQS